jgi:hypothetical protein
MIGTCFSYLQYTEKIMWNWDHIKAADKWGMVMNT